ncbi:hypothetical protein F5Y05DRAFT_158059 [Hypoxylon sp. FL0543]|nr:hypothetical protein F5Y05DRAFT_158059 [Hypoxylon sp. FL0543]
MITAGWLRAALSSCWSITYFKPLVFVNSHYGTFSAERAFAHATRLIDSQRMQRKLRKFLSSGVKLNICRSLQLFPTSNAPIRSPQESASNRWPARPALCSVWFSCHYASSLRAWTRQLGKPVLYLPM